MPNHTASARGRPLRAGAINVAESTAIGVASTAPAYSLAVSVGLLVGAVGGAAPLTLVVAAIPVLLMVLVYREFNKDDPNCGTTFAWAEDQFGVGFGRMVGWTTIVACVLVMSSLAQVAVVYGYNLFALGEPNRFEQAVVGTAVIGTMAYLAYRGVQIAANTQIVLVTLEFIALMIFVVGAIVKADSFKVDLWSGSTSGWGSAFLIAVFLYWGWDSSFSVNEESKEPRRTPVIATLVGNGLLVVVYALVTYAALAYAGTDKLAATGENDFFAVLSTTMFNTFGGKLLVGAVLVSALSSTQTTILPTARTMLSMARRDAFPGDFAKVSARYQTPHVATWTFAGVSAAVYVVMALVSDSLIEDAVASIAVLVSLYYIATALALVKKITTTPGSRAGDAYRHVIAALAATSFFYALFGAIDELSLVSVVVIVVSTAIGVVIMFSMKPAEAVAETEVTK